MKWEDELTELWNEVKELKQGRGSTQKQADDEDDVEKRSRQILGRGLETKEDEESASSDSEVQDNA